MTALVPQDQPVVPAQRGPLEVPGIKVERETVGEDDGGQLGIIGRGPLAGQVVDLDVQRGPVGGDHRAGSAAQ